MYVYDGDGKRVKKAVTASGVTTTTYYVHNALRQLAAEYSTQAATTGTTYIHTDMLGSTRLVTNSIGAAVECYDYLPFGRMLTDAVNGRDAGCYPGNLDNQVSSKLPQKFTGKERDAETKLDFFGARYYSGAQGRWLIPDWSDKPAPVPYADLSNPQTLNLYAYVRNNPLTNRDADGHCDENGWCGALYGAVQGAGNFVKNAVVGTVQYVVASDTDKIRMLAAPVSVAREEYSQKGASGVTNAVLDQGASGAMSVVTEAVLIAGSFVSGKAGSALPAKGSGKGTFALGEAGEIQAIVNEYNTIVDVVGSRAKGEGRNIHTDLPVGKGPKARSDIDFRIDSSHPQVESLIKDLMAVGRGAGSASTKHSTTARPTYPPYIRFHPEP